MYASESLSKRITFSKDQSGRGLPQSKTLREGSMRWKVRQLLECGSPLPLYPAREVLGNTPASEVGAERLLTSSPTASTRYLVGYSAGGGVEGIRCWDYFVNRRCRF